MYRITASGSSGGRPPAASSRRISDDDTAILNVSSRSKTSPSAPGTHVDMMLERELRF